MFVLLFLQLFQFFGRLVLTRALQSNQLLALGLHKNFQILHFPFFLKEVFLFLYKNFLKELLLKVLSTLKQTGLFTRLGFFFLFD